MKYMYAYDTCLYLVCTFTKINFFLFFLFDDAPQRNLKKKWKQWRRSPLIHVYLEGIHTCITPTTTCMCWKVLYYVHGYPH